MHIAHLARYPVKSMGGEEPDAVTIGPAGVLGDRAYGVIDSADGLVASAKQPRKWARLLECQARLVDEPSPGGDHPPVEITFPDGSTRRSDTPGIDSALSAFTGREVRLMATAPDDRRFEEVWPDIDGLAPAEVIESTRTSTEPTGESVSELALGMTAPPGTFFDLSVLHLLTTSTLDALAAAEPGADFSWRRYRPNAVVGGAGEGFVENDWPGSSVALGPDVVGAVSMATMRCVMTTLAHRGDVPADRSTLQAIARENRIEIPGLGRWACAGVYADVVTGGSVSVGDEVRVS